MNTLDAITTLISMGDELTGLHPSQRPVTDEQKEREATALAAVQATLNTAIPVTRFRIHVAVEAVMTDAKSRKTNNIGVGDLTLTGASIPALKVGLVGLMSERVYINASLWEQKKLGAEMHSGYEGWTKCLAYREWLHQLDFYEVAAAGSAVQ